ncbi:hypothetical protein Purlil1_9300 [Purpureocillium lilacinum]|uniref:Uncharacterized protein n=1 Tax=Purpureocillium lilacinum TaxID=33203 RepID=A0ABR0BQY4_PURLI|nr:hypothetical protein Purlil1_9300 [Purpureocillium lilacinum]
MYGRSSCSGNRSSSSGGVVVTTSRTITSHTQTAPTVRGDLSAPQLLPNCSSGAPVQQLRLFGSPPIPRFHSGAPPPPPPPREGASPRARRAGPSSSHPPPPKLPLLLGSLERAGDQDHPDGRDARASGLRFPSNQRHGGSTRQPASRCVSLVFAVLGRLNALRWLSRRRRRRHRPPPRKVERHLPHHTAAAIAHLPCPPSAATRHGETVNVPVNQPTSALLLSGSRQSAPRDTSLPPPPGGAGAGVATTITTTTITTTTISSSTALTTTGQESSLAGPGPPGARHARATAPSHTSQGPSSCQVQVQIRPGFSHLPPPPPLRLRPGPRSAFVLFSYLLLCSTVPSAAASVADRRPDRARARGRPAGGGATPPAGRLVCTSSLSVGRRSFLAGKARARPVRRSSPFRP